MQFTSMKQQSKLGYPLEGYLQLAYLWDLNKNILSGVDPEQLCMVFGWGHPVFSVSRILDHKLSYSRILTL